LVSDRLTVALVVVATTAVVLVSTLAMSVPTSVSPLFSLNPFSTLWAGATPNGECSGNGRTSLPVIDGAEPFDTFSADTLVDAQRALIPEVGRTSFQDLRDSSQVGITDPYVNNIHLSLYDRNNDGITDCAIVNLPITIQYKEWTNVGDLSDCVRDEWLFLRYNLAVDHEHHHRDDAISVWTNAHLKFVGKPNTKDSVQSILNPIYQQYDMDANAWDNANRLQLNRCCSGATYDDQSGACKCNAASATYNEQGGTANNPNGGCECPSDQDLHLGIVCLSKCTGGQIHTGLLGTCKCPFGTTMQNGQCVVAPRPLCTSGLKSCVVDGVLQCINVDYDESNCGDCGKTCSADQQCINGQCRIPGQCRYCDSNNPCPGGTICAGSNKCYPYTWSTPANTLPCGAANSAYYNCPADRPQGIQGPDRSWTCRGEGAGKMLNTVCINFSECR
jgi:hypothetical protein